MNSERFTPGPWKAEQDARHLYFVANHDLKTVIASEIPMHNNCNLISAAPDMYEALRFCQSVIKSQGMFDLSERMAFDLAELALNKANPK